MSICLQWTLNTLTHFLPWNSLFLDCLTSLNHWYSLAHLFSLICSQPHFLMTHTFLNLHLLSFEFRVWLSVQELPEYLDNDFTVASCSRNMTSKRPLEQQLLLPFCGYCNMQFVIFCNEILSLKTWQTRLTINLV